MSKVLPWMPKRHRGTRLAYIVKTERKYASSRGLGSPRSRTAESENAVWDYYEAVTRPFAAGFGTELGAQILTEGTNNESSRKQ
jgi:hypothetical protein